MARGNNGGSVSLMDESILISVIVPVYNVENYLRKCIDSILAQTYKNLQIILVDDGSSDASPEICDEYAASDSRICIIHQSNMGPTAARKAGLNIATGEYIGFVDSDDWIEPNMYEEMLKHLLDTGADFVYTGLIREKNGVSYPDCQFEGRLVDSPKDDVAIWQNLIESHSFTYLPRGLVIKLFKHDLIFFCFHKIPNDLHIGEDYAATVECILHCKRVLILQKAYYHYVIHDKSLITTWNADRIVQISKRYEYIKKRFEEYHIDNSIKSYLLANFVKDVLNAVNNLKIYKNHIPLYAPQTMRNIAGKRIIIYGAGTIGHDYYVWLCKNHECEVVDWVDKKYIMYHYPEYDVHSVETIKNINYDLVLIAVKKKSMADIIINELTTKGIPRDKLCWEAPKMLVMGDCKS